MSHTDQRLERARDIKEWLAANRDRYLMYKGITDDLTKLRRVFENLRAIVKDIVVYNPLNEPHVAVHLVARTQASLEALFADLDFVEEYEEKRSTLAKLNEQLADSEGDEDRSSGNRAFIGTAAT